MQETDIIYAAPTVQQTHAMVLRAQILGFTRLIIIGLDRIQKEKLYSLLSKDSVAMNIQTAFVLKKTAEYAKAKKQYDLVFAPALREFFEIPVDGIIDAELSDRNDHFHFRSTALNHVHAQLVKDNAGTILFSYALFNQPLFKQQIMLGRMQQNAHLVRKYHLKNTIASFAKKPEELVQPAVLHSFSVVLGLKTTKM